MLVGKNVTLKDLKENIKAMIDEKRMEARKAGEELAMLQAEYERMPKMKNEPPTEKMAIVVQQIRQTEVKRKDLEELVSFLKRKWDEAEEAKDENQSVYMTLKDCLFYDL